WSRSCSRIPWKRASSTTARAEHAAVRRSEAQDHADARLHLGHLGTGRADDTAAERVAQRRAVAVEHREEAAHLGAQAEVGAQVGLDPRAERGREARLALELRRLGDETRGAETRTDVRAETGLLLAEEVVARELVDLDRQVEARL